MADTPASIVTDYLRQLTTDAPSDAELLAHFAATNDSDAFAQLVTRHGPMVLGVCRRGAGDSAEDAFQATFLALARQAGHVTESLPGWLHRVATRIARRTSRGPSHPLPSDTTDPSDLFSSVEWKDLRAVLDAELAALPHRLRTPLVLCYLDGLTRDEAARRTNCSLRTLHRRLDEGRRRLRDRLTRRGLAPVLLGASVLTAEGLRAAVPPELGRRVTELATGASAIPPAVTRLIPAIGMQGVVMKTLVALVVLTAGLGIAVADRQPATADTPGLKPADVVRTPRPKDPRDELAQQTARMKTAAVAWLVKQQEADGSWEANAFSGCRCGASALAVLALLESGLSVDDVTVKQGLNYLRGVKTDYTYNVSLQTQALCRAGQKQDAKLIMANVAWLEKVAGRNAHGRMIGWSYGRNAPPADTSNTRYAVSGLYVAHKAGFKVEQMALWDQIREHFVKSQRPDGGWGYGFTAPKSTKTMTCSALLCLAQVEDVLGQQHDDVAAAMKKGFAWLDMNFAIENASFQFYYLDALAQMGAMSKRAKFGDHDWRREGAAWMAKNQRPDGHFQERDGTPNAPAVSTAFALRFLRD